MKIPRTKKTYQILYAFSHAMYAIYVFIFGFKYLLVTAILGLAAFNLSAELYSHRISAHNHFDIPLYCRIAFDRIFSMCGFGSIAANKEIHIRHHKFSDLPGDPHDFRRIGLLRTVFKEFDQEYLPDKHKMMKYLRVANLRAQQRSNLSYFVFASIVLPFLPVTGFWLINLLYIAVHMGREGNCRATNVPFLFPLMWGAEYHRDHHFHPSREKMHRFDLIYYIGKALELLPRFESKATH